MREDPRERHTTRWWSGIVLCLSILVGGAELPSGEGVLGGVVAGAGGIGFSGRLVESIMAHADNLVSGVAVARHNVAVSYPNAGSNIDTEVQLHSATDVLRYLPRALQIGLFAPFPEMWSGLGVSPGADHMRLLAGIEMALAYLLLPGVALVFMRRELYGQSAVALIQAVIPIIVLALVVCNVGTLYRMRYGYWQILIGLGVIGWGMGLQRWSGKYSKIAG